MPTFEEKLVRAVKRKREAEGLSIRALSDATGISFSTLARIERGEGQPDNNSKIRLLEWLGPEAEDAGLRLNNVAFVHFRAGKNIRSSTVHTLLKAADSLHQSMGRKVRGDAEDQTPSAALPLSKEELEQTAEDFRKDLGVKPDEALDSLQIEVQGVQVIPVGKTNHLDHLTVSQLRGVSGDDWSAMSVPLDIEKGEWAILLNDSHTIQRQRVTILEEYWHILLGHKLTKIAKVTDAYGRTYDKAEEHDAFYLAAATLLPKAAVIEALRKNRSAEDIAAMFGTSSELVDYRIKRLGLWRHHIGKRVSLTSS